MKPLAFFAVAAAVALGTTVPAWAHAEISPGSVPTGKPVFFTVSAANEKSADLTRITLTAPEGLELGHATRAPAGWTVSTTPQAVSWTGGTVGHDRFESWGFEIEGADQPGTRTWRVTLGYADGSSEDVEVPLAVTAADSTGGPVTTPATAAPATAAVTTPAAGTAEPAEPEDESGEGRANVALAISVVALVASVAAAVLAGRRGRAGAQPAPSPAQDW